jgi:hypothetical protein
MLPKEVQERIKQVSKSRARYIWQTLPAAVPSVAIQPIEGIIESLLTAEAERSQKLIQALEKIQAMKMEPGETDYRYAFNRIWHIATDILTEYNHLHHH